MSPYFVNTGTLPARQIKMFGILDSMVIFTSFLTPTLEVNNNDFLKRLEVTQEHNVLLCFSKRIWQSTGIVSTVQLEYFFG